MPRNPLRVDGFHPTIGSVYHAVEGYLEHLAAFSGMAGTTAPLTVPPIDALLIRLLTMYQPSRPYLVDLAAAHSWGVSTLLCRTDPSVHMVVTIGENPSEKWRTHLDHYLLDWTLPLVECVTVGEIREAISKLSDLQASPLVIAAASDATRQQSSAVFESWLEWAPQAVLVLLGVDKTGNSSSLASLIVRCTSSNYRLALLRELAPALAESRIALVTRRENVTFESVLSRIGHQFANQFQFLDVIKRICDSALEQSVLNEPLPTLRAGVLEPQSLTTTYDLRRALVQREQELMELRQSFTFRVIQGIRKLGRFARRAS
jgi:hypothetical protein